MRPSGIIMPSLVATARLGGVGSLKLRFVFPHSNRTALNFTDRSWKKNVVLSAHGNTGPEENDSRSFLEKISVPVVAVMACALLSGAVIPEEALAARSGGRIGGSSFRSRAPAMPRGGGGGGYRQYNYYGAPPLMGGYGYGMGGYGLMPSFFFPIGFGGIFNIMIALFIFNAVVNAIRSFQNDQDERDDFDDL